VTRKNALPAALRSLVDRLERAGALTPATARDFLAESEIYAADLEPWTDFGHPRAESFGRRQVYDGRFFELDVQSWIDGDVSAIHRHADSEGGAVRVYGAAEHAVFRHADGALTTRDRRVVPSGSVIAVAAGLVHQLGNVGQEPFLTLQLHGRRGREGSGARNSLVYDLDGGEVQRTGAGAFFDLPETEVLERRDGPEPDFPTYVRHQVELLKRTMVRDDVLARRRFRSARQERLAGELFAAPTWQRFADEWSRTSAGGSLRLAHYARILSAELRAVAALQKRLVDAGLAEPPFDAMRLAELLAFADRDRFADGYLELVADTYSLALSSLAAA
jgi:hypothetical protein